MARRVHVHITHPISTQPPPPSGFTPTTLAIDGGPTYYATNGFTYASSPSGVMASSIPANMWSGIGWDDPRFFPIALWGGTNVDTVGSFFTMAVATFLDLGFNYLPTSSGSDPVVLRNNRIWSSPRALNWPGTAGASQPTNSPGVEAVGLFANDEPANYMVGWLVPFSGYSGTTFTGHIDDVGGFPGQYGVLHVTSTPTGSQPLSGYVYAGADQGGLGDPTLTGGTSAGTQIDRYQMGVTGGLGSYVVTPNQAAPVGATTMTAHAVATISAADQANRFWTNNLLFNWVRPPNAWGVGVSSIEGDVNVSPPTLANALITPPVSQPGGASKFMNMFTVDFYWCSGSLNGQINTQLLDAYPTATHPTPTQGEGNRGSHYGDTIDYMRAIQSANVGGAPAPLSQFQDVADQWGAVTNPAGIITPQNINWSVWSQLVHGARMVTYIDNNFGAGTPGFLGDALSTAYFQVVQTSYVSPDATGISGSITTAGGGTFTLSGITGKLEIGHRLFGGGATETTITRLLTGTLNVVGSTYSVDVSQTSTLSGSAAYWTAYNRVKYLNNLVFALAPILNSPFVTNLVTAVSPTGGYFYPQSLAKNTYALVDGYNNSLADTIDVMAKNYTGSTITSGAPFDLTLTAGQYIFATTRGDPGSVNNLSATFTVATGSSVTVVNEGRTIAISGGQFTDTFAKAWTVHIYKVNP